MADDLYVNDPEYKATLLESQFPPPYFPPNKEKQRFHPYGGPVQRSNQFNNTAPTAPSVATPAIRSDVPPHVQPVSWIPAEPNSKELTVADFHVKTAKVAEPDYNEFSLAELVEKKKIAALKVSRLSTNHFVSAQSKSNPYDSIGSSIFSNAEAVKLANLDKACSLFESHTLQFLEVGCQGGFAEYIFYKLKNASGFGIATKGLEFNSNILQNKKFNVIGNCNDLQTKILEEYSETILKLTESRGLDFVAGLSRANHSNDEFYVEYHSKQLILWEILLMFKVLRKGGDFILKVFDINCKFTVDLIFLLYRHFEKIAIVKPLSSRPIDPERYLVCKRLQMEFPVQVISHLSLVNDQFNDLQKSQSGSISFKEQCRLGFTDVISIIDPSVIKVSEDFIDSIQGSNMRLLIKQRESMEELVGYAGKRITQEYDQADVCSRCLKEWNLPTT